MNIEKIHLENNIKKLYLMSFVTNTNFHLVVFTIFLLSKGFNMKEFFLIVTAFMLVMLLMEIPTGAFSDKISRKWSLIIASLIGIPTMITIILSNTLIVVITAMAISGVAGAFISGTDSAMMYDTLKALKREKEFKKINGKLLWYNGWAGAIGGIFGGLLAQLQLSFAWWATFIAGIFILFIQITLVEPPFYKESKHEESYLLHLGRSFRHSFTGNASFFVLYAGIAWLFFHIGFWLWQPYLKLISIPVFLVGVFYAVERIINGYASKKADFVEEKIGMKYSLLLIPIILSLSFLLQSQFVLIFGFLFIFLQSITGGYFYPLLEDYINKRIPSSKRATILSIKNMISSLLFVVLSPLVGIYIDVYSLTTALLLMGIVLLAISLMFFMVKRNMDILN